MGTGQIRDGQEGSLTVYFFLNHVNVLPIKSEFKKGNVCFGCFSDLDILLLGISL